MGSGKSFGAGLAGDWRNDVFGTTELGDDAQSAAMEQQRLSAQFSKQYTDTAQAGFDKASLMSQNPQQLQALTEGLGRASKQAESDQRLMDAIDPAIMEASKQALSILQGGGSAAMNPLMAQSNDQRRQLVNSLREQYGPGAETSAIGQNALRQFDLSANAQSQGTLAQLFGMGTTRVNGAGFGNLMGAAQGFGQYGMQGAQTQLNGTQMLLGAQQMGNQGVLQSSGAQWTSDIIKKRQQQQFFSNWSDSSMAFGQSMSGSAMGGGGGGGGPKSKDTSSGGGWQADANQNSMGTEPK